MRNSINILAEKYTAINETPLEVELLSNGEHKSDQNVSMARTKALQAADASAELYELLENLSDDAPMHAWKVTNVTQAADMIQDVLASLKADLAQEEEPVELTTKEEL